MAARTTENKLPVCKQCGSSIASGEDHIVCEGFCHNAFHVRCANINADTFLSCRTNPCVWWLCGSCTNSMRTMRNTYLSRINRNADDSTSSNSSDVPRKEGESAACSMERKCEDTVRNVMEEIAELKAQVGEVIGLLSESKAKLPSEDIRFGLHSTPVSSEPSIAATSYSRIDSPSCQRENNCTTGRHSFSLLLSNINSCVTDREVDFLVSQTLGITEPDSVRVTKLVPRWKVCEELDYVSFKVVLDAKWRSVALSDSTWPKPIRYREFVNRRCVTWSPTQ